VTGKVKLKEAVKQIEPEEEEKPRVKTYDEEKFTPEASAVGGEAEKDSPGLWRIKGIWKKLCKRDRKKFLEWVDENGGCQ